MKWCCGRPSFLPFRTLAARPRVSMIGRCGLSLSLEPLWTHPVRPYTRIVRLCRTLGASATELRGRRPLHRAKRATEKLERYVVYVETFRYRGTFAWRNNNPGNLRSWPGAEGVGGSIAMPLT